MNPLTLVKRIQKINQTEASLGISDEASWHAKYKDSAYVFVGGIPFDLTEGDLLAVFAQYGEIVDVNLVRDKATGKSKGFAFVAYEDQRSTNLAVDNLNGAQVLGRIIRVDHCSNYKKKEEEDEETERQKREARGVCRAFQKGECNRGSSCKFSHDEQRAANTGWGAEEHRHSRWVHDNFEGSRGNNRQHSRMPDSAAKEGYRASDKNLNITRDGSRIATERRSDKEKGTNDKRDRDRSYSEGKSRMHDDKEMPREDRNRRDVRRLRRYESESYRKEERDSKGGGKSSPHHRRSDEGDQLSRDDLARREAKRLRKYDHEPNQKEEQERRKGDRRSGYDRDSSPNHIRSGYDIDSSPSHRRTDERRGHRSHR